jgi:DNA-binding FrmR family transcriptional regulator
VTTPAGASSADRLSDERKAELLHRLRRAEGQVRGLQKLLTEDADCTKIAQQLLATRHALDSTYVRLNLAFAENELAQPDADASTLGEVIDMLQNRLGRAR